MLPPKIAEKLKQFKPYVPNEQICPVILNAGEHFYAPDTDYAAVLKDVQLNRYPDPRAEEVCRLAAAYFGVGGDTLPVAGNGSDELISLLCTALLPRGSRVLVAPPDFSMYEFYAATAELELVTLPKTDSLQLDMDSFINAAQNVDTIFFSTPCNPTGQLVPPADIERLLTATNALVVVDEAYMDFAGGSSAAGEESSMLRRIDKYSNLIVLRTCSKAFGLAGIRLGFAFAQSPITEALHAVRSPFNINALTQAVGAAILSQPEKLHAMTQAVQENKAKLEARLSELFAKVAKTDDGAPGCASPTKQGQEIYLVPALANFVLLRGTETKAIHGYLQEHGIATRLLPPDLLRITVGSETENGVLWQALCAYYNQ